MMQQVRFFGVAALAGMVFLASALDASAQGRRGQGGGQVPGGRGFGPGAGFGPGGGFDDRGPAGRLGTLMQPDIRKELEIVPEQEEKLRTVGREIGQRMREVFSGLRDLPEDQRRTTVEERMRAVNEEFDKRIDEVLLPNQKERLGQIILQRRAQRRGTAGALASDETAKALGLTDEQKKKLQEVGREVQKEIEEKLAKIREEAEQKVLEVLTPEQREQYKKMLGERYQPPPPPPRERP
jgi:Spy/CpxP family protein refolding chaperone